MVITVVMVGLEVVVETVMVVIAKMSEFSINEKRRNQLIINLAIVRYFKL